MNKNLLSVIITAFNVEKYLKQCIESVLNQSYLNIEIIIIDDGSSDGTYKIIEQFISGYSCIKALHKKNEGIIKARYDGISIAEGDYITFVDGDDWIEPDMYDNLMKNLIKHNADMITSGIIRYYSDNDKKFEKDNIEAGYYNKNEINKHIIPIMLWDINNDKNGIDPSLCTKIFNCKKLYGSMHKLIQGKYNFHYGEDIAILYPYMLNVNSIIISDKQYYYHRQRERNVLADYIMDEYYFEKLFSLYKFLKNEFFCYGEMKKQLEYFYMYSINIRKKNYNDIADKIKYIFPFDKIDKGSKIVLYGAGVVGNTYYNQLMKINYCKVVLWVDKNYLNYQTKEHEIKSIYNIFSVDYNYIVICNSTLEMSECIKKELIAMGVEKDKIV